MSTAQPTQVHIVSHTHWDREWYLTYEQFRLRLAGLVDRLLDMMETEPDYQYFHLDGQTIVLEDYLEIRPHQERRLRRLIADGRILIGPWYDMPDEFLVSGESLVRNLARGHGIARQYGTPMPVGYLPDLFGHVGQMPQILRQFGLDNAILWRGFGGRRAEYWWRAPDGSRVLMMHLPPEGYCNATRVHLDPAQMVERTTKAIRAEATRTSVGEVLLMNGVDHVEPHRVIPELARQMTSALGVPVRHSTLPAYVDAVRDAVGRAGSEAALEVIEGELRSGEEYANLLPGVFSARVYLKQANARVQTLLEKRAEPLASFAWMIGAKYPADELRYAWKTLLQNHPHDSICGCSIDPVHEENMTRFARAEQVARGVVDDACDAIARALPAGAGGILRLAAINTNGRPFHGAIEAVVDLPYESAEPRRVVDTGALDAPVRFWPPASSVASVTAHDGRALPFQILSDEETTVFVMSRHDSPWALRARRIRLAWLGEVPACGYTTVDLGIGAAAAHSPSSPSLEIGERSAANAHVRIAVNDDGTVDVLDKRTGNRYPRCGALEDVGDIGDEYNYAPPQSDRRVTSSDATDVRVTRLHDGPVRAAFRIDFVLPLPVSATADRAARSGETAPMPVSLEVSLDADSPRIEWQVVLDNGAKDHRLRMHFPAGAKAIAEVRAETAFGVKTRPARREVPAEVAVELPVSSGPTISFTEAGDDRAGAILYGEGLAEYEATDSSDGPRLGLTLLRSVGFLSRDDLATRPSGHAGPGLATPGAQCLGQQTFRLAFEPRTTAPSGAELFALAASFISPPHLVPVIGSDATLPASGQFLHLDAAHGDIVLSACHKSDEREALVLRLFNADAEPATVRVGARKQMRQATRVDFLERPVETLPIVGGATTVEIGPHVIATLLLEPRRLGASAGRRRVTRRRKARPTGPPGNPRR